jgi:hypothetical protein
MADEQQNQKLQYVTQIYIGKYFNKKFENQREGGTTISYKYKFKNHLDDQYSNYFWGYDHTTGAETLVEGELFVIGYIESPNPRGDKPIKGVKFFGKPDNTQKAVANTVQKTYPGVKMVQVQPQVIDSKEDDEFVETYRSNVEAGDWSAQHFAGTYMGTIGNALEYQRLKSLFNSKLLGK